MADGSIIGDPLNYEITEVNILVMEFKNYFLYNNLISDLSKIRMERERY